MYHTNGHFQSPFSTTSSKQIIQERRLLEEIDSPFVCNLRFAFQDDENLFMVLDLMLGGDLRFHLDRLGGLKEEVVKFYVAEMALALGDLHKRGIVHRCVVNAGRVKGLTDKFNDAPIEISNQTTSFWTSEGTLI